MIVRKHAVSSKTFIRNDSAIRGRRSINARMSKYGAVIGALLGRILFERVNALIASIGSAYSTHIVLRVFGVCASAFVRGFECVLEAVEANVSRSIQLVLVIFECCLNVEFQRRIPSDLEFYVAYFVVVGISAIFLHLDESN